MDDAVIHRLKAAMGNSHRCVMKCDSEDLREVLVRLEELEDADEEVQRFHDALDKHNAPDDTTPEARLDGLVDMLWADALEAFS